MGILTAFAVLLGLPPAAAAPRAPQALLAGATVQLLCVFPPKAGSGDPEADDTFMRSGRRFRRVGTRRAPPPEKTCPDASDPICLRERRGKEEASARSGYFYGWFRDVEGQRRYGRLYLPHYGKSGGNVKNEPPPVCRTAKTGEEPGSVYRPLKP